MELYRFREELTDFYRNKVNTMSEAFEARISPMPDAAVRPQMTGYQRKVLQYETNTAHCS